MAAKAILILCAQAVLFQSAYSQSFGRTPFASGYGAGYGAGYGIGYGWGGRNWGYDGLGFGTGYGWGNRGWGYDGLYDYPARGLGCASPLDFTPTSGGSLVVTSASAIPPTGISIVSDNAYEGILAVAGEVPFVGTTGMEGALPTAGAGAINYGCGNGITAMVSDISSPFGLIAPSIAPVIAPAFAPAIAPATIGCGCGRGIY